MLTPLTEKTGLELLFDPCGAVKVVRSDRSTTLTLPLAMCFGLAARRQRPRVVVWDSSCATYQHRNAACVGDQLDSKSLERSSAARLLRD